MKQIGLSLGVLLGLLMIWLSLGGGTQEELEQDRPLHAAVEVAAPSAEEVAAPSAEEVAAPSAAEVSIDPAAVNEPSRRELPSPPEKREAGACAEAALLGIALDQNGGIDEEACATAMRILVGPRVPVLPNFPGFEIPDYRDAARSRLFGESDNPAWSRAMESRILEASSRIADFPLITLNVVCRSSTCGVLFVYAEDAYHGGSSNYYAQQLADDLGFRGFQAGSSRRRDGIGFTFAYLGDWYTPRPEW